jgi:hypothetical protein
MPIKIKNVWCQLLFIAASLILMMRLYQAPQLETGNSGTKINCSFFPHRAVAGLKVSSTFSQRPRQRVLGN